MKQLTCQFLYSFQSILRAKLYVLFNNVYNFSNSLARPSAIIDYHKRTQKGEFYTYSCNRTVNYFLTKVFDKYLYINFRRQVSTNSSSGYTKEDMLNYLPFFTSGEIVSGFGRGSKELGIPTANYPLEVVKSLPDCFKTGIYFGWANVNNGPVYKMVMSIGWNPFYDNKEKSMETHILHEFNRDLYGCLLKVCIAGYLRPERNFKSLEELIACIRIDRTNAEEILETIDSYKELQDHQFFLQNSSVNSDSHTNITNSKSNKST